MLECVCTCVCVYTCRSVWVCKDIWYKPLWMFKESYHRLVWNSLCPEGVGPAETFHREAWGPLVKGQPDWERGLGWELGCVVERTNLRTVLDFARQPSICWAFFWHLWRTGLAIVETLKIMWLSNGGSLTGQNKTEAVTPRRKTPDTSRDGSRWALFRTRESSLKTPGNGGVTKNQNLSYYHQRDHTCTHRTVWPRENSVFHLCYYLQNSNYLLAICSPAML